MTRAVNLLPWRAARRQRERNRVLALIAGIPLLAVLVAGGAWWQLVALVEAQEARNAHLEGAIREVEDRLDEVTRLREERERIQARMAVLEGLVARRGRPLVWLNALVEAVPEAVVVERLEVSGGAMEVAGRARSNDAASAFMNGLEAAAIFRPPRLEVIEERDDGDYRFRLHVPLAESGEPDGATDGTE